ncbi:immunity 49 family protein [Thaumasiovibrio subtropicus]|uniref:immunity 49 family protein n=1 Tax=Thaumasiovibrio subtropicus TaxID=1891207 RepID=UPI001C85D2C7|nr:immunity 49 family protein [Thaumasiovibrio subtropicus]
MKHHIFKYREPENYKPILDFKFDSVKIALRSLINDTNVEHIYDKYLFISNDILASLASSTLYKDYRNKSEFLLYCINKTNEVTWKINTLKDEKSSISIFGKQNVITKPNQKRPLSFIDWLEYISVAEIIGFNSESSVLSRKITPSDISVQSDSDAFNQFHKHCFSLFNAFFQGEKTESVQIEHLRAIEPYLERGKITEITGNQYLQYYYQWLIFPLISLIACSWGYDNSPFERAVEVAIQANYEYYSMVAPENGDETGENSRYLYDKHAVFHLYLNAMVKKHIALTGKKIDFDSVYLIDWMIYEDLSYIRDKFETGESASEIFDRTFP